MRIKGISLNKFITFLLANRTKFYSEVSERVDKIATLYYKDSSVYKLTKILPISKY